MADTGRKKSHTHSHDDPAAATGPHVLKDATISPSVAQTLQSHDQGHGHGHGHDHGHDQGHTHGHDQGHGHGHSAGNMIITKHIVNHAIDTDLRNTNIYDIHEGIANLLDIPPEKDGLDDAQVQKLVQHMIMYGNKITEISNHCDHLITTKIHKDGLESLNCELPIVFDPTESKVKVPRFQDEKTAMEQYTHNLCVFKEMEERFMDALITVLTVKIPDQKDDILPILENLYDIMHPLKCLYDVNFKSFQQARIPLEDQSSQLSFEQRLAQYYYSQVLDDF